MDSRIQLQLEEDGGGSTRQSWMETSGLWTMFHWERQGITEVIKRSLHCLAKLFKKKKNNFNLARKVFTLKS